MAQLRTILIGKARRITLDELYSLSKRESKLEAQQQQSAVDESSASSSSSSTPERASFTFEEALATLTLTDNESSSIKSAAGSSTPEDNKKLLSEEATIASLGLLAITIAQGRIIRGDCAMDIAFALAELVNVIVTTEKKPLLCLPIDSTAYLTVINNLLSSSSSSSSSSSTLPKLEDGPYISRLIHLARVSIMLVRGTYIICLYLIKHRALLSLLSPSNVLLIDIHSTTTNKKYTIHV
jgi:hypothetical protein